MNHEGRDEHGEDGFPVPSVAPHVPTDGSHAVGQLEGTDDARGGVSSDTAQSAKDDPTEEEAGSRNSDSGQQGAKLHEGEVVEGKELERISEVLASAIEMSSESFSGLLPHPDHWERYGPEWQERVARMSESYTTDESARRDRIVAAQIKEAGQSRRAALAVIFGAFVGSIVSAGIFDNTVLAVAFIAVPVMQGAREFLRSPRQVERQNRQRSEGNEEQKEIEE